MPEKRQKNQIQTEITTQLAKLKESCDAGLSLASAMKNTDDTSNLFDFLETFNEQTDEVRSLIFELEDVLHDEESGE